MPKSDHAPRSIVTIECSICKQSLTIDNYTSYESGGNWYLRPHCKQCARDMHRAWRKKKLAEDPTYFAKKQRESKCKTYNGNNEIANRKYLLHLARKRAKKGGFEFSLTEDDITLPTTCRYLGIKLDYSRGNGLSDDKATIDRIDSTKGYIAGNIQIISYKANTMKSNATPEELLSFARRVLYDTVRNCNA